MEIEELIMDPENADVYYCLRLSTHNCRCVEEFVMKHCWMNANLGSPANALKLLKDLRKAALGLSNENFTRNDVKIMNGDDGRSNSRCLGNRKSKKYVQYIIETRRKLRSHGICEYAAQNILKYSNKIIYRKLKYDYEKRNDLIADEKSNLKRNNKLLPIEELMEVRCYKNKCTNKLKNYVTLYSKLRSDSKTSRKMKKEAITKLLMTAQGEIPNCNKFIVSMLGESRYTIRSIKKLFGLGKNGLKKQKSKRLEASAENLKTNMPVQTSNTQYQTTDAVNNCELVNPIPQDMGQACVNFQNNEVLTTQTQRMSDPVNGFEEFNPTIYSLFQREQFQNTDPMNQNISSLGCANVTNESHQFCVPNEGVASANQNLYCNYIGCSGMNLINFTLTTSNNNLLPQEHIIINLKCPNIINNFYYKYVPTHSANMNTIDTTNPSPHLYSNGMPATTHTPSTFG